MILSLETGGIDDFDEGGTEEILDLSLPSRGEFSIVVGGFEGSVGNYRLTLTEASEIGTPEGLIQRRDTFPSTGSLAYGQFVDSRVAQDITSTWTFNGTEGDNINIKVEPLDEEFDVLFDVLDEKGKSILEGDKPNYTIGIGALYILLIGVAVILGFRSLFRKSPE